MEKVNFQDLQEACKDPEKSKHLVTQKSKSIERTPLPIEVFEAGLRLLHSVGVPALDDETTTVWYATVQGIPEPAFQEAVRAIMQGTLKPNEYASATERSIPALIRGHWEAGKEQRIRKARMQKQYAEQREMETMERPTLEQVKAFNQKLKAGELENGSHDTRANNQKRVGLKQGHGQKISGANDC